MEPFQYKTYNIERLLDRLRRWPEAIEYAQVQSIRNLRRGTIAKNLCDILSFLTFCNHPLDRISPGDVHEWLLWEKNSFLKDSTFQRRTVAVKSFFRTIKRKDLEERIPSIKFRYELKDKILTREDVQVIVDSCKNPLEEALIRILDDTGCRVGELLTLRKSDVQEDELGIILIVRGKTGERPVRLVNSISFGKMLGKERSEPDDLLFRGRGYDWAYWIFRRASQVLGRKVSPHMFRHTKATLMAKLYTEGIIKKYLGWSPDSKMMRHYSHLSSRDVDLALLSRSSSASAKRFLRE
ncbi:tyrosine-type recombinase/integrase [candidate division TA06 bacterium]|nr:tyrosine-type recombinase/integrase [candidate division TA06 bacterium]